MQVLLLSMPFGALDRPALGISLLKAALVERGLTCEVRYPNYALAELIGAEEYRWIASDLPYTAFAGDWCFTESLYGPDPAAEAGYIEEVLRGIWKLPDESIRRVLRVRALIPHFMDWCMDAIPWARYDVVGFTSTFEQNIASLSLARRVKAIHPRILTVFGGANWEGEMGLELHRCFSFVDYVCSGEADRSFPALIEDLRAGRSRARGAPKAKRLPRPGIVYRDRGESRFTGPAELLDDLDSLPVPDYSDFFDSIEQSTVGPSVVPMLLLETSRGCWWGAKSHCTFCGLNGGGMRFRSKGADRVVQELRHLVARWAVDSVEVVDNILDMNYFRDLLPRLAESESPVDLFYEVKANLTRDQVALLRRAGVNRIQPGIESMSNRVLKLMRKGTTALRNVQLLKWCREYGISADWNLLYGFPGESLQDYEAMLDLFPAIRFLGPPSALGPVRLDRFSPYFDRSEAFGLIHVRPMRPYFYLYPFTDERVHRIAYYFDYDYAAGCDPAGASNCVIEYVERWQRQPEVGALWSSVRADGSLVLTDRRSDAAFHEMVLSGPEQAVYEYCDEVRSSRSVTHFLQREFRDPRISESNVLRTLESFVTHRLMVKDDAHFLSLAIGVGSGHAV
jgi:ribosomal peptide maturation radical SAM protein 1